MSKGDCTQTYWIHTICMRKGGCGSDDDALSLSIRKLSIDIHTVNHFDVVWMVVSLWSNNDSEFLVVVIFWFTHSLTHSHLILFFLSFFSRLHTRNKKKNPMAKSDTMLSQRYIRDRLNDIAWNIYFVYYYISFH